MAINPYSVLGVEKNASYDEINRAYFRLAKEFYPDINKSSEANRRMQEINTAYEILKNPEKRKQYDFLHGENYTYEEQPTENYSDYEDLFRCQRCGAVDHTLRIVQFPYVISLLFVTLRRGWAGIFCSECRKEEMAKAKIISLFLGWWGFPWGIFYTLETLFSIEGKIPPQPNAEFLKILGLYLFSMGDNFGAKKAFEQSNEYQQDDYISTLIEKLEIMNPKERGKEKQPKPTLTFFRISLGLAFIIPIMILSFQDRKTPIRVESTPTESVFGNSNNPSQGSFSDNPLLNLFSWDTYYDSKEGFSIDYPSHFEKEISNDRITFFTDRTVIDSDFVLYVVYIEDLDFNIISSDLTNSFIYAVQDELFVKQGYSVIDPLEKENIAGYPALSGKFSILIEEIDAIEYSSIIFKNNRVYTLVVIGPKEVDSLMNTYLTLLQKG